MRLSPPALVALASRAAAETHSSSVAFLDTAVSPVVCATSAQPTESLLLHVLASACLSDSDFHDIKTWLSTWDGLLPIDLAPVPDECLESRESDRFTLFEDVATVVDRFDEAATTPIGIVGFVGTNESLEIVHAFAETEPSVPLTPVFLCDTCSIQSIDITSLIECPNQPHTVALSYLNDAGTRECVCQCERGYKRGMNGTCERAGASNASCAWTTDVGFRIENTAALPTCWIANITEDNIVPVPGVVVVHNGLTNASALHLDLKASRIPTPIVTIDSASAFPSVYPSTFRSLTPEQIEGTVVETDAQSKDGLTYTIAWDDYGAAAIDALAFSSYGQYALELEALDTTNASAMCSGCVAIVDQFRPKATRACPPTNDTVLEPTRANMTAVYATLKDYFEFQSSATNDACARSAGRCDAVTAELKDSVDGTYIPVTGHTLRQARNFFGPTSIQNYIAALDPPSDAEMEFETPGSPDQCTRCLKLSTALKEWYFDYDCSRDYSVKTCVGDSNQTCTFEQCYAAAGETVASATASLSKDVQKASQTLLDALSNNSSLYYNAQTQVHIALSRCTEFPTGHTSSRCQHGARLSEWFDLVIYEADLAFSGPELGELVQWRYQINDGAWQVWNSSMPKYMYKQATTPFVIEAWSRCGRVGRFEFTVHLHLSTPPLVCDSFAKMWSQVTRNPETPTTNLCTYPQSNFAELTFNYTATTGLTPSEHGLPMAIKDVVCRLHYIGPNAARGQNATIVESTLRDANITKRVAVVAYRAPGTTEYVGFHVTCEFQYQVYDSESLYVQSCGQNFTIEDCSNGTASIASALDDTTCTTRRCTESSSPGPYEACGGTIVHAKGIDTKLENGPAQRCCAFCAPKYTTLCTTLPELLDNNQNIQYCVPTSPGLVLSTSSELLAERQSSIPIAALSLGAGLMIAGLALVVVHRRRAPSASGSDVEAYSTLLQRQTTEDCDSESLASPLAMFPFS